MVDTPRRGRFEIKQLDESDPAAVYDWAMRSCRFIPIEQLAEFHGVTHVSETAITRAIVRNFPTTVRDAARRGCQDGFAATDDRSER
jgi:hypothetical protein